MQITLTPEMEHLVRERMAGGGYSSAEEVVNEALTVWQDREPLETPERRDVHREAAMVLQDLESGATENADPRDYPALNEALRTAVSALDRGDGIPGETVFEELKQRSAARRTGR
jgi:Arc/MetJ-type ribon-helix-helix transcriptional regulator